MIAVGASAAGSRPKVAPPPPKLAAKSRQRSELYEVMNRAGATSVPREDGVDSAAIGPLMVTEAIFSFWPGHPHCLQFESKEVIYWIMQRKAPPGWGLGLRGNEVGLFPLTYVQLIDLIPEDSEQRNRALKRRYTSHTLPAMDQQPSGSWKLSAPPEPALPICCGTEGTWRQRALAFFDDAESSLAAQYWTKCVMVLIGISIVAVVVTTMNSLHDRYGDMLRPEIWDTLEFAITMVFSFEYVSRLVLVETSRVSHILQPLNLIDLASITPFYLDLWASQAATGVDSAGDDSQAWMRVLRVARVFRVLKLGKYSSGLQLFGSALSSAAPALVVQLFLMLTFMVVCASLFFYAEQGEWDEVERAWLRADGEPSPFDSIPKTFWWATVSMTTVGYGDVFPISAIGRAIATVTMFIGVLSIAMPVSVVTSNFQEQYHLQQQQKQNGGRHLSAANEFRARYLELRQAIVQLHVMLAAVQNCAQSVHSELEPALQKSRVDKILAERALRKLALPTMIATPQEGGNTRARPAATPTERNAAADSPSSKANAPAAPPAQEPSPRERKAAAQDSADGAQASAAAAASPRNGHSPSNSSPSLRRNLAADAAGIVDFERLKALYGDLQPKSQSSGGQELL